MKKNEDRVQMTVRELSQGDFFTKRPIQYPSENQVWIRGKYDRSARRYACTRFSDLCDVQLLPGDKVVFCDFIF